MSSTYTPGLRASRSFATRRCADAMLRGLGGTRVTLRVADASTGDTQSQLGLEAPVSEDIVLWPAVVKAQKPADDGSRRFEVLLSSTAVKAAAEARGIGDAASWLLTAQGLLYRETLLHIDSVISNHFAGSEYVYHVLVTE